MVLHGCVGTESSANAPLSSESDALEALWFQEARKSEEVKHRANGNQRTPVSPAGPVEGQVRLTEVIPVD